MNQRGFLKKEGHLWFLYYSHITAESYEDDPEDFKQKKIKVFGRIDESLIGKFQVVHFDFVEIDGTKMAKINYELMGNHTVDGIGGTWKKIYQLSRDLTEDEFIEKARHLFLCPGYQVKH